MSSKVRRRLDRLATCVQSNDTDRLESYLKRRKYAGLNLDEAVVNHRGETLLHLACRLCRPNVVKLLFARSLGDPTARDLKGNTPLHLALNAVSKIDSKHEYLSGMLVISFL